MLINPEIELLTGMELHQKVIQEAVLHAENYVWIATANLKDMHITKARGYRPILEAFNEMAGQGIRFRIIHSDLPSRPFRRTLDRFPRLIEGALELQICRRSHWKMVIVDGRFIYLGSANFTGAGLGVKGEKKRNLELGITSGDPILVSRIMDVFDAFWIGTYCLDCSFRKGCADPITTDSHP
jgi:phosphatidylserine/phosphatidylglycerophosphate/cardiolipin synthase-like enzyme